MLKYKVISRRNPLDSSATKKFYTSIVFNTKVSVETLAERISRNITMGKADIMGVLIALEEEIIDVL